MGNTSTLINAKAKSKDNNKIGNGNKQKLNTNKLNESGINNYHGSSNNILCESNSDMLFMIFDYLSFSSKHALSLSCKSMRQIITGKSYFLRRANNLANVLKRLIDFEKCINKNNFNTLEKKQLKPWSAFALVYKCLCLLIGQLKSISFVNFKQITSIQDKQITSIQDMEDKSITSIQDMEDKQINFTGPSKHSYTTNKQDKELLLYYTFLRHLDYLLTNYPPSTCGGFIKVNGMICYLLQIVCKYSPTFPFLIDLVKIVCQDNFASIDYLLGDINYSNDSYKNIICFNADPKSKAGSKVKGKDKGKNNDYLNGKNIILKYDANSNVKLNYTLITDQDYLTDKFFKNCLNQTYTYIACIKHRLISHTGYATFITPLNMVTNISLAQLFVYMAENDLQEFERGLIYVIINGTWELFTSFINHFIGDIINYCISPVMDKHRAQEIAKSKAREVIKYIVLEDLDPRYYSSNLKQSYYSSGLNQSYYSSSLDHGEKSNTIKIEVLDYLFMRGLLVDPLPKLVIYKRSVEIIESNSVPNLLDLFISSLYFNYVDSPLSSNTIYSDLRLIAPLSHEIGLDCEYVMERKYYVALSKLKSLVNLKYLFSGSSFPISPCYDTYSTLIYKRDASSAGNTRDASSAGKIINSKDAREVNVKSIVANGINKDTKSISDENNNRNTDKDVKDKKYIIVSKNTKWNKVYGNDYAYEISLLLTAYACETNRYDIVYALQSNIPLDINHFKVIACYRNHDSMDIFNQINASLPKEERLSSLSQLIKFYIDNFHDWDILVKLSSAYSNISYPMDYVSCLTFLSMLHKKRWKEICEDKSYASYVLGFFVDSALESIDDQNFKDSGSEIDRHIILGSENCGLNNGTKTKTAMGKKIDTGRKIDTNMGKKIDTNRITKNNIIRIHRGSINKTTKGNIV